LRLKPNCRLCNPTRFPGATQRDGGAPQNRQTPSLRRSRLSGASLVRCTASGKRW
jgi:hypothetical protein